MSVPPFENLAPPTSERRQKGAFSLTVMKLVNEFCPRLDSVDGAICRLVTENRVRFPLLKLYFYRNKKMLTKLLGIEGIVGLDEVSRVLIE